MNLSIIDMYIINPKNILGKTFYMIVFSIVLVIPTNAIAFSEFTEVHFGNCTIFIFFEYPNARAKGDVVNMAETLRNMIKNSADMRNKLQDACDHHGNSLSIHVYRDSPDVTVGENSPGGSDRINIDLGDIEKLKGALSGKQKDIDALAASLLIDILAHELDHTRDRLGHDHNDPDAGHAAVATGPAVDDANAVHHDLNTGVHRDNYVNGNTMDFTVNGQHVVLNVTKFVSILRGAGYVNSTSHVVSSKNILQIPEVCHNQNTTCFPSLIQNIRDKHSLVLALGQRPSDIHPLSNLINWAVDETCQYSAGNHTSNFTFNQGCIAPPPNTSIFPRLIKAGSIFALYNRMDMGGIQDGFDVLPIQLEMSMSQSNNNATIEIATVKGPIMLERMEPFVDQSTGYKTMKVKIIDSELHGNIPSLGNIKVSVNSKYESLGMVQKTNQESIKDFPADFKLSVYLVMDTSLGKIHSDPINFTGTIDKWPLFGNILTKEEKKSPVKLFNDYGEPVAQILDAKIMAESPPTAALHYDKTLVSHEIPPPLKQISRGISPQNITCKPQLELLLSNSGDPLCMTDSHAMILIQHNLAKFVD